MRTILEEYHIWHPFTQHKTASQPLRIVRAKDTLLFDEQGNSYIDANSSWWVNVHGHGNRTLQKALENQFSELDHVVLAGVTHPKAEELSRRICETLPSTFKKVFFSDNGSTSVEVALKMVIQYWYNKGISKKLFIALEGSYHGDTFGAMSVGQRGYFNEPFEEFFFDVAYIPFPTEENIEEVLENFKSILEKDKCAGLILEPLVQGAAGMKMYSAEILDRLVELARKYDVKIIFDEVMTGFGRTGKLYAMDHCSNKPDVVCLSKGLTGGVLPLGLTVASLEIYDAFLSEQITRALLHGHSFTGNAISCAVSCASLDLFAEQQTWNRIRELEQLNSELAIELQQFVHVQNIRQTGTILAFEVSSDSGSSYFSNIRDKAYSHFLKNGVLLRPLGNTIFINPPYCITKEEYSIIKDAIKSFLGEM